MFFIKNKEGVIEAVALSETIAWIRLSEHKATPMYILIESNEYFMVH